MQLLILFWKDTAFFKILLEATGFGKNHEIILFAILFLPQGTF
jgi:hypothetical protein